MTYRLGIDLGTASVGVIAAALTDKKPTAIAYGAVRIFDEPLEPPKAGGVGEPKKATRRVARQSRRQHHRRAQRLIRIAQLADQFGLKAITIPPDKGQKIIRLRAAAVDSEIPLEDFFRVLLHLEKRRGYMGTFRTLKKPARKKKSATDTATDATKTDDAEEDKRKVKQGIDKLKEEMRDHQTLGQYLFWRQQQGLHCRLKDAGLYADVGMVRDEFARLWQAQQKYHAILQNDELRDNVEKALFFKMPMKSPAAMVGNCLLNPLLPRAAKAQPYAQSFAIEKQIADVRYGEGRQKKPLTPAQKEIIRNLLQEQKEAAFSTVKKALADGGHALPANTELKLEAGGRETLKGDATMAAMRSLGLADEWQKLADSTQAQVINLLADMGEPDIFVEDDWHENLFCAKQKDKKRVIAADTVAFIELMKQTDKFDRLGKMGFDTGRVSYSLHTLKTLVSAMRDENLDEHYATEKYYPKHTNRASNAVERFITPPRTGNTVVDVALRQLAKEVYRAVAEMDGFPTEVIVEMSRDLRLGLKQRNDISTKINRNKKKRDAARKAIQEHGAPPSETNIRRYLLWEEQQQKCPYCGNAITVGHALDGSNTHFEHILPRALTRIGKNRDYLVLAHSSCNDDKGKRTPWQAWGNNPARWRIIEASAEQYTKQKMYGKAKQLLYQEEEHLDDAAIDGFSDRQFHETSWIAKTATNWLREIFPEADVSVSRGILTAHFRHIWGLETIIPELRYAEGLPVFLSDYGKTGAAISQEDFNANSGAISRRLDKRIDHRHHLIDAAVICMTSRSLYQMMAKDYKQASDRGDAKLSLRPNPPIPTIRQELQKIAAQEDIISHRPDRFVGGRLFKENPYAVITRADGKKTYAQRKMLTDLAGPSDSEKTVRSRIAKILCDSTREAVMSAFDEGREDGKKPVDCLQQDILHPHQNTKIRRVLVDTNESAEDAVKVVHQGRINRKGKTEKTELHKYLRPDGYAYLEVSKDGDGNFHKKLVPTHIALKNKGKPKENVWRFYKQDTVRLKDDGKLYVVRQIWDNSGGALVVQRVQDARTIKSYTKGISSGKKVIANMAKLSLVSSRR